jgi:Pyruvate/2-oxoacid:ferredoxin oxidoreductase delta subunit
MIKDLEIFYFTGTGNARKIAMWFGECAENNNISYKLHDISKIDPNHITIKSDSFIVIISPIHGFNFPKITIDFIRSLPKGNNNIVLMNTRAGGRLGKIVTPGLTGIAFMLSSIILSVKGYKIKGEIPVDMPSNWISIHPAYREKTVKYLYSINYNKVKIHAEKIFSGEKDFMASKDIIQDLLISPISFLFYLIGRYVFAKSFYASYKCDNCNLCIKECPVEAIIVTNNRPYWTLKCESCMKCMNNCSKKAIETSHGLISVLVILNLVLSSLIPFQNLSESSFEGWIQFIIKNILFFGLLVFLYRIQQVFLNYKYTARIISYFSLTHYKFWGRYKSLSDYKWKNPV